MQVSKFVAAGAAILIVGLAACGGGGSSSGGSTPPTSPTPTPTPTGTQGVVAIMGDRGAQSFSPNPGTGTSDQMVQWRNSDTVVHHIVINTDTSLDTGDIAPGATSKAIRVPSNGANYHCTIHPGMIGSIQGIGGAEPPPCTGQYC